MHNPWGSVTFRIALVYSGLIVVSMALLSAVFYLGTVGVQASGIDSKLLASSKNLSSHYEVSGLPGLETEIQQLLDDGIDQDTEVYLLIGPDGRKLAGNLNRWPDESGLLDTLVTQSVLRYGRPSSSRLLPHRLPDGAVLVVGRDLKDQQEISTLVWRSLAVGGGIALLLAFFGATLFRRQIGRSIAAIRRTALEIQAGDLSRRIPVAPTQDEFARLSHDINGMLDRIEQLMDGVRHVSNTIAHNLRTPLARIRSQLEDVLRHPSGKARMSEAVDAAIQEIDVLTGVFEKLLRVAEAESGTRRQSFEPVELAAVMADVAELYDAMAESCGMKLQTDVRGEPKSSGDRDLLSEALANLIENAIKHASAGGTLRISTAEDAGEAVLVVEDRGPGIPQEALGRITERFYRLNPGVRGSGLGLSIVAAIVHLHRGNLEFEDAAPGLRVRIRLPRAD